MCSEFSVAQPALAKSSALRPVFSVVGRGTSTSKVPSSLAVAMKFAGELPPLLVRGLMAWCASSGRASRNLTANTAPRPGALLTKPSPRTTILPSRHFSVEMVTFAFTGFAGLGSAGLGSAVGSAVGAGVGSAVAEGSAVGSAVAEGSAVGSAVAEGSAVTLGSAVGSAVAEGSAVALGSAVGAGLGAGSLSVIFCDTDARRS